MKGAGLAVFALLFGGIAEVRLPVEADVAAQTVRADRFPQARVDFPGDVIAYPGVEVANYDGYRPVRMDIYAPRGHADARPVVLWVHGGGWSRGDARTSAAFANWPSVLASLAARGFVVAALDYRLSGEARFPAQIQDVFAAIDYLRREATALNVDGRRVYLWGASAGGHLAALAALACDDPTYAPPPSTGRLERRAIATAPASPADRCVQGAALWYGVFDLEDTPKVNVAGLLGCDPADCSDKARLASPIRRVHRHSPPMLLIHGTADRTVDAEQSQRLAEALGKAGAQTDLLLLPDVDHGFIGATPADTRASSLRALDRTFEFFESAARR